MLLPSDTQAASLQQQLRATQYAVLPGFVGATDLSALRAECETLVEFAREQDGSTDLQWAATARGCVFETVGGQHDSGSSCGGIQFQQLRRHWPRHPQVANLLFGPAVRALVHAALGTPGYLFNDQYIVKPPQSPLSAFGWHRDSDWMRKEQMDGQPYISVWIALTDMTSENGSLLLAPQTANISASDSASKEAKYVALDVKAGTAVVMTDRLLHSSPPNMSQHTRAAWMPQFSAQPIRYCSSGQPVSLIVAMDG